MDMWITGVVITLSCIALAAALVVVMGNARRARTIRRLEHVLQNSSVLSTTRARTGVDPLPAPVQRYIKTAAPDGLPSVLSVAIGHNGTFRLGDAASPWLPFTSEQSVTTDRPGFVWNARIRMAPGVPVRVVDAYTGGDGTLAAHLLGAVPVMRADPTPELAQGELMRYLAEAVWYPTALRPHHTPRGELCWEAIDDADARVTLRDGETVVSLDVHFGPDGLIDTLFSDRRVREVDGHMVPTPWECRVWNYTEADGMVIPLDGEVAWLLPEGRLAYWQGHIERIAYTTNVSRVK